jgi:hypothetical protein
MVAAVCHGCGAVVGMQQQSPISAEIVVPSAVGIHGSCHLAHAGAANLQQALTKKKCVSQSRGVRQTGSEKKKPPTWLCTALSSQALTHAAAVCL